MRSLTKTSGLVLEIEQSRKSGKRSIAAPTTAGDLYEELISITLCQGLTEYEFLLYSVHQFIVQCIHKIYVFDRIFVKSVFRHPCHPNIHINLSKTGGRKFL